MTVLHFGTLLTPRAQQTLPCAKYFAEINNETLRILWALLLIRTNKNKTTTTVTTVRTTNTIGGRIATTTTTGKQQYLVVLAQRINNAL